MSLRLIFNAAVYVILISMASVTYAQAVEQYPFKPIRLIVSGPSGSISDIYARHFATRVGPRIGQPIYVENRPGASGAIALAELTSAPADGYTIYFGVGGELVVNRLLGGAVKVDPTKDLAPIAQGPSASPTLLVSSNSPFYSLEDLVEFTRQNPDSVTCGTAGQATLSHFVCAAWARRLGLLVRPVPYKGNSPALVDTAGGQITFALGQPSESIPYVMNGRLRPLVVFGSSRLPVWPEVRRIGELGYKDLEVLAWTGFFAPAGTPSMILVRLNSELIKAVSETDLARIITEAGGVFHATTSASFTEFIYRDTANWRSIISELGIRLN